MTFEKAKQEFEIRCHLWTISEWEKEINESFPNLRHFKSGRCWEIFQFMQQLVSTFITTFGSQCVDMKISEEWDPQFHIKCCGWIINTQLVFGRRQGVVWYRHIIESENRVPHPRFPELGTVPTVTLSSWVAWLENRWENVMDEDVEAVSNTIVKVAGFFFESAPRLLKGLEFEKITSE